MIEIGSTVDAVVTRALPYGVFLQRGKDTIFVPLSNLSWTLTPDTLSQFVVGQTIRVLVERFNYEKCEYVGSLKHLMPENNPYRAFISISPDEVFRGVVKFSHLNGVLVELNKWCFGELPLTDETRELTAGDVVYVQITSLEVSDQRISLRLVGFVK